MTNLISNYSWLIIPNYDLVQITSNSVKISISKIIIKHKCTREKKECVANFPINFFLQKHFPIFWEEETCISLFEKRKHATCPLPSLPRNSLLPTSLYINHHPFSQTKIHVPLSLVLLCIERASMHQPKDDHMIEMVSAESTTRGDRVNLNKFFANVESANYMLNELERLQVNLEASHEQSKMVLLNSNVGKGLRSRMDEYFYIALETAKVLKLQLDALHRSNQSLPDGRLGSVMDQTRLLSTASERSSWPPWTATMLWGRRSHPSIARPYGVRTTLSRLKTPTRKP